MERLLSDATKISGVKYDISNLNDVYSAIHVIQEQMGITGTTAKEASETISGSLGMTKSAWENLVTGFSNKDADLSKLIDNFVNSATTFIENLLPVIETALNSIVSALPILIDKIVSMLPGLLQKILPVLIDSAIGLLNGLVVALPGLIPVLMDGIVQAVRGIVKILPILIQSVISATILIIQALAEELPTLLPLIVDAILEIIPILIDCIPLLIDAGGKLAIGLLDGIMKSIPKILAKMPELGRKIVNCWANLPGQFMNIGKNLIQGLINGIGSMGGALINAAKNVAKNAVNTIKKALGIHSPSRVFFELGEYSVLGYTNALDDMQNDVKSTIDSVFNLQPNISGAMSSTYSPNMVVNVENNMEMDPLGQLVNRVKTFSGGAKNDYNWGAGI